MSKQDTMRQMGERFAAGDLEGALAFYTEDAVHHVDGRGPTAGDYRGRDAIAALFRRAPTLLDSMQIEVHDTLFSDDHAVLLTSATMERAGRSISTNRVAVYHFEGDLVSEAWVTGWAQQEMDEFLA